MEFLSDHEIINAIKRAEGLAGIKFEMLMTNNEVLAIKNGIRELIERKNT